MLILLFALVGWLGCDSVSEPAPPEAPLMITPADGATDVSTALEVEWEPCDGAEGYHVQVSTSPQFADPVMNAPGLSSTYADVTGLRLQTRYYWRVRAYNAVGDGAWSPTRTFTPATVATPPATPRLTFPADGARSVPEDVVLHWEPVDSATRYHVQVSQETNFLRRDADMGGIRTHRQQIIELVATYTYYWRVRAENPAGVSAWSPFYTFVVLD